MHVMIGTDRVGLAVSFERIERTLSVGEAGGPERGDEREGGVETARLNRDSVGDGTALWRSKLFLIGVVGREKGKVLLVGVVKSTAFGGGTDGLDSNVGGVIMRVGPDPLRSAAASWSSPLTDLWWIDNGLAPARRPFVR